MNPKTLRLSVPALAVLAALCSCSVKEDRTECPCCVTVMTETDSQCLVCFFDGGTSLLDRKTMLPEELTSGDNFTDVRKGPPSVCVLQTSGDALVSGNHTVSCREGMEADPVYAWSVSTLAEGEELLVRSSLQKQYAALTVYLAGDFPYDVRVESALGGLDLTGLSPTAGGGFSFRPQVEDGNCRFRILRQKDGEPIMLYSTDKEDGSVIDSVDLNRYISRAGYNWAAASLDDISIALDYVKMTITVSIDEWSDSEVFTLFE